MKQLLIFLSLIISAKSFSQDSTKITISLQGRDVGYIAAQIFNNNEDENVYDSLKVSWKAQSRPEGTGTVSVTGYTCDWYRIWRRLKHDETALNNNCVKRMDDLLRAVGQSYLTGKMDAFETELQSRYQISKQFGINKLKRQ